MKTVTDAHTAMVRAEQGVADAEATLAAAREDA